MYRPQRYKRVVIWTNRRRVGGGACRRIFNIFADTIVHTFCELFRADVRRRERSGVQRPERAGGGRAAVRNQSDGNLPASDKNVGQKISEGRKSLRGENL